MATMKDVAKHANVGIGTVSRFLNNTGYLSEPTKIKISNSIKELGYVPNQLARNFAHNSSRIIAIIVPDIAHPFFSTFTKNVEMKLYASGYKSMICNTVGISDREKMYLEMLDRNIVDGIITCSHTLNNSIYANIEKPIVSLDHDFGTNIPMVYSDHKHGGIMAANLFINANCKNVIQFMTPKIIATPSNERHEIFEKVLKENNIHVTTFESEWNIFEYKYFYNTFKTIFSSFKDIDGIFATDFGAACCLKIFHEKGISVPNDIKIVGYDGLDISDYTFPQITTIAQNIEGLASSCVEIILKKLDGNSNIPSRTILDLSLKLGGSI